MFCQTMKINKNNKSFLHLTAKLCYFHHEEGILRNKEWKRQLWKDGKKDIYVLITFYQMRKNNSLGYMLCLDNQCKLKGSR